MKLEVTYILHVLPTQDGGFIAYFPALPGCHTQAGTVEEVIVMAKDALAGYLWVLVEDGQPIPEEKALLRRVEFDVPMSVSLDR